MAFDYELTALEKSRLEAATAHLISAASAESLTVTAEQLVGLGSVKMAVLTDLGLDFDRAMDEVRRLVPDQIRTRDLKKALADAESSVSKDIYKMDPARRLALGRELLAQQKATEEAQPKKQMDATEEAQTLLWLRSLPPAERLSAARRLGIC